MELQEQLFKAFEKEKNRLGFTPTFEQLDEIFFLKDHVLQEKYVSEQYSRMLCSRITQTYSSWVSYLHSFIMPNPHSFIDTNQVQAIQEKDRHNIQIYIGKLMQVIHTNTYIGIKKDAQLEKQFIDESYTLWFEFKDHILPILEKVGEYWKQPPIVEPDDKPVYH
ncbi:MAG: hypothetical protein ACMXYF_03150 [Candidatus Woesearchaeota archaeon]